MRQDLIPKTRSKRIARVLEEAGEVIKAIGKLQRFGKIARDPKTKIKYDNVADLRAEMKDLRHAIDELERDYNGNVKRTPA